MATISRKNSPVSHRQVLLWALFVAVLPLAAAPLAQAEPAADATDSTAIATPAAAKPSTAKPPEPPQLPPPADAKALPNATAVWINRDKHIVYVDGKVSLRQGLLEMFACPRGTKEHESVVAVDARSQWVHTALLLIGAQTGTPVRFVDKYEPPTGDIIDIQVQWLDPQGKKQTAPAKNWVRDAKTRKAMQADWVFAGSGFWTDEESGEKFYMAEGGDLICVANFSTATLDLAVKSTQANEGLLFEAYTENVPALGTPVRLVMTIKKHHPAATPPFTSPSKNNPEKME